jgi:threonine dehydrogenase-like Zn-dependent dehydrogenase
MGTPDALTLARAVRPSAWSLGRHCESAYLAGKKDVRYETVPDPVIEHGREAIIKTSCCAICGSDPHLFDGFMPSMESGDILGHEFMGEIVEVVADNTAFKVGDRIVVPFTIVCGECDRCRRGNFSVCERSNRNKDAADKVFGHGTAGLFDYSEGRH